MKFTRPLIAFAYYGHKTMTELLLNKGADVTARAANESTPLHFAADVNQPKVAELLLANGADVNARNRLDETPLLRAAMNGVNCSKDMMLEFGDVVEIPEREHALSESAVGLTGDQQAIMFKCRTGKRPTHRARPKDRAGRLSDAWCANQRNIIQ